MSTLIVDLVEASEYDQKLYGITHRSRHVYRVGPHMHNALYPHRVQVWDNTRRPNTDPERFVSGRKVGPGAYVAPDGSGTDCEVSIVASAEPISIDRYGTGTGTEASGQVWADGGLGRGNFVVLRYPSGELSDPLVLRVCARDIELVPVVA